MHIFVHFAMYNLLVMNKSVRSYFPEKHFVFKHHLVRNTAKLLSSFPYLSGDYFSNLADYSFPEVSSKINQSKLINAKVLYIPSNLFDQVIEEYKERLKCKTLLSGNSDFEFRNLRVDLPKSVERAFLQNSFISDNIRIFTLPIGIENLRHARNGFRSTMKVSDYISKKNRILIGPFSPTSPIRKEIVKIFANSKGPWDVIENHMSPYEYPKIQSKYRYVLCPPGNGIDTHRLWETIYRGGIPIVLDDSWSRSLPPSLPLRLVESLTNLEDMLKIIKSDNPNRDSRIPAEALGPFWRSHLGV